MSLKVSHSRGLAKFQVGDLVRIIRTHFGAHFSGGKRMEKYYLMPPLGWVGRISKVDQTYGIDKYYLDNWTILHRSDEYEIFCFYEEHLELVKEYFMPKYKEPRNIFGWKKTYVNGPFKKKHIVNYRGFLMVLRLKKLTHKSWKTYLESPTRR